MNNQYRVGLGYDLHRLIPGTHLTIGGVKIPYHYTFQAHSDGDLLVHAILDSLLTPLGMPDIGTLFPDTDPMYQGVSSLTLLRDTLKETERSFEIVNIDAVIILDRPILQPYLSEIKQHLADAIYISPSAIGVKGKTSEQTRILSAECHVVTFLKLL